MAASEKKIKINSGPGRRRIALHPRPVSSSVVPLAPRGSRWRRPAWRSLASGLALAAGVGRAGGQGFADNPAYHEARGPIPIRDARPYNLLFLQFPPESPVVLTPRANGFGLQLDLINNLLRPRPRQGATVIEDNEMQRLAFSWRRGIGRGVEVSVTVPVLWRNGGALDGILSKWHRFFGFSTTLPDDPGGRDSRSEYQSRLFLADAQGNVLIRQGNAFGLGETRVILKHGLTGRSRRFGLAARLGLKLPTGNPVLLLGSGSFDLGLSLDARYTLGRKIIAYANFGGVLMGRATYAPGARPTMLQTFVGLEYRPNNRDSFLFQIDGNGLALRTGNAFADGSQVTATFGYKRVLDRHLVGFASFSENGDISNYSLPQLSNIGPDITFSTGLEWHP